LTHSTNLPSGNVYGVLLDKVLGCGYGTHYNEDNLIYDKIIFSFDADIDGEHMSGLTLSSIYALAPQLVLGGHCYRVITPLYKIAESQTAANKMSKTDINADDYVYSKTELFDRFERNVIKYARLKFSKLENYISQDNMRRFLVANRDYYEVLDQLSTFETVPKEVIEFIAATPKFDKYIKDLDPELSYSDGQIFGCFKGEFVAVNLTKSLMEKVDFLRQVIQKSNDGIYQYEFYDRRSENSEFNYVGKLTIGEIMELCQKYSPYIVSRYKGLGEMSKYEMWKFAMNPNYRRLARYTVSDVQKFESTMDDLFVMNPKGRRIRKQMVQTSNLSLDEIDN
jgi:DNA gyrase/topoisomerase IV subunit B